jgi:hypothetical protein
MSLDKIKISLTDPVKVQQNIDGENTFVDLDAIHLVAPSYRHKDHTLYLKKSFIEALFGMTQSMSSDDAQKQIDSGSDTEDNKLDAKAIKATLYASRGFDIVEFFKKFVAFLGNNANPICFKDEDLSQPLSRSDIEKMSEEDLENLIAKYIEVFFIVSWMKTLK